MVTMRTFLKWMKRWVRQRSSSTLSPPTMNPLPSGSSSGTLSPSLGAEASRVLKLLSPKPLERGLKVTDIIAQLLQLARDHDYDAALLIAQAWHESRMDPLAESPAGA